MTTMMDDLRRAVGTDEVLVSVFSGYYTLNTSLLYIQSLSLSFALSRFFYDAITHRRQTTVVSPPLLVPQFRPPLATILVAV